MRESDEKESPLEALRRNPNAITDAVYGRDHPEFGAKARAGKRKAPPQNDRAAVQPRGTLLGDTLDPNTKTALAALRWRLERKEKKA